MASITSSTTSPISSSSGEQCFSSASDALVWLKTKRPKEGEGNFEESFRINGLGLAVLMTPCNPNPAESLTENEKSIYALFGINPANQKHARVACLINDLRVLHFAREIGRGLQGEYSCIIDRGCIVERARGGGISMTLQEQVGGVMFGSADWPTWNKVKLPGL